MDDLGRPRAHGHLIFHSGGLPLENLEKYARKTNILAPNKNEMEMGIQIYLAKEPRTPELYTIVIFFWKSTEGNTTIMNIYVTLC